SFATTVEQLGGERWLAQHGSAQARAQAEAIDRRRSDFRTLTLGTRAALDELYRSDAPDDVKRDRKVALMTRLRTDYEALKAGPWKGFAGYDVFFAKANNASLG